MARSIQGVAVIEAGGSHRKIGETIGEVLRERLRKKAEGWKPHEKTGWRVREYLAACEKYVPELLEEMRGIERGAALPENFLLSEWAECTGRKTSFPEECSNVVFSGGPDGPLWGKNNDGDAGLESAGSAHCILKLRPDKSIPIIICTYCGWICGDSMNAEGVATGGSSGGSLFLQSPYDVPDLFWIRAGMDRCRTAEEFARHVTSLPLRGKGGLMVTVDRTGCMFSTEVMPPLVQIRRPRIWSRGMNCTNWYQLPLLKDISGRSDLENSMGRSRALEAALKETTLSLEHMKNTLRHHGEYDICRHGKERHDYGYTEWSMIGIPREGKLLFCNGRPCQGTYEEICF